MLIGRHYTTLLNRVRYLSDIDTWCDDLLSAFGIGDENVLRVLHYDELLRGLKRINPALKVTLIPFELLHHAPTEFHARIATVFNMDSAEVKKAFSVHENVTGKRLRDYRSGPFVERLLRLRLVVAIGRRLGISRTRTREVFLRGFRVMGSPRIAKMSEETEQRVRTEFRRANSSLAAMTGLDLSTLGYAMNEQEV